MRSVFIITYFITSCGSNCLEQNKSTNEKPNIISNLISIYIY